MNIGRKEFLKRSAMSGATAMLGIESKRNTETQMTAHGPGGVNTSAPILRSRERTGSLVIFFPRDGDVLNRHDGVETGEHLMVLVRGRTPSGAKVTVNDVEARVEGGEFLCEIPLARRRNTILAQSGDERDEVAVWWNKGSRKRFRFSVDDNIEFLKDLGLNPDGYPSLFDHWYLAFWREMHSEYGAKIHLNIYYQTDGFDLTEMPDKWRDEWQENASWLRLSFHALQDLPDRPYRNARYAQIAHDYDLVCGEIRRFAGNEVITTTTTIHWAECPKDAITALRHRGIENLVGLFRVEGEPHTTGYYFDIDHCRYCDSRGAWYDRDTGLMFMRCTSVVNRFELEEIEPFLESRTSTPHTAEMVELFIHEQYFRKELRYYQPSVQDKVRAALRWVTQRSYEPVFWSDGFLGTPQECV